MRQVSNDQDSDEGYNQCELYLSLELSRMVFKISVINKSCPSLHFDIDYDPPPPTGVEIETKSDYVRDWAKRFRTLLRRSPDHGPPPADDPFMQFNLALSQFKNTNPPLTKEDNECKSINS